MTNLSCLSFGSFPSIMSPGEVTLLYSESKLTPGGAARGTLTTSSGNARTLFFSSSSLMYPALRAEASSVSDS